jgi:4-hydroxybenzoate adenylyltransferase
VARRRTRRVGLAEGNLAVALLRGPRDGPVLLDDAGSLGVEALEAASARAAGALREAGVRRGDRALIALPAGRRWLQAFLGAVRLGAIAVPLDPAAPPGRLASFATDARAALMVGVGRPLAGVPAMAAEALDDAPEAPPVAVGPDHLAFLVSSSGTTGRPKLVAHAHGPACAPSAPALGLLGLGPGVRCHAVARPHSALGLFIGVLRPLLVGATIVLTERDLGGRCLLAKAGRHGVHVAAAVPAVWAQVAAILERRPEERERLSTLRVAVSSGDRLPPALTRRLREAGGPALVDALGSAEAGDLVLASAPGRQGLRPLPGVAARRSGRGAARRLLVRAPGACRGYWGRPEESAALRRGRWVVTPDVLRDEDGALVHVGRTDDLFRVAGRWIAPGEVEDALHDHPAIAEAAVLGTPDRHGGSRVAALIVPSGSVTEYPDLAGHLRRHVAARLGPAAAPATVTLVGALPRFPSGKLDRRRLASDPAPA